MERQIKFRGKRTDTGEWIYGDLLTSNGTECEISDWNDVVYSRYDVDLNTVGQFIGILESNSVEVYDRDIIKDSEGLIGVVCWDNESLQWVIIYAGCEDVEHCIAELYFEVIGNEWDSPELLEGGEQ